VQELVSKLFNVRAASQPAKAKEGRKLFTFGGKNERTVQQAMAR
jgi:hypothetical protein